MKTLYIAPSIIIASWGRKLQVNEVLDPHELGWAEHPMFGELPTIRVVAVTDDGRLLDGTFTCTEGECGNEVLVHSGDWFQKRRCAGCQAKHGKGKRSKALSEEQKAANKVAQAAKRQVEAVERAKKKLDEAVQRAQPSLSEADRRALIEKVAAEHGVPVSPNAPKAPALEELPGTDEQEAATA